jgi:hypothetical protein
VTTMPGFTAEASLCRARKRYVVGVFDSQGNPECVQPAMRDTCDTLAGLLWEAYFAKSYGAAQLFYDAMEVAGCFRSVI